MPFCEDKFGPLPWYKTPCLSKIDPIDLTFVGHVLRSNSNKMVTVD